MHKLLTNNDILVHLVIYDDLIVDISFLFWANGVFCYQLKKKKNLTYKYSKYEM